MGQPDQSTINFFGMGGIAGIKFPVFREKIFLDLNYNRFLEIGDGDPSGSSSYAFLGLDLSYRF